MLNKNNFINKIFSGDFSKGVFLIAGGTAFAQTLNALFYPIITRVYSPDEYGILTLYISLLSVISVVGALKYEWAIPIVDNDEKAINIIMLCIFIILILSLLLWGFLTLFGISFLTVIKSEGLIKYHSLIPIGTLLLGLYSIFSQWAFRNKDLKILSKTKLIQSFIQNIIQTSLGYFKIGPIGLIIGFIAGQSAGISTLGRVIINRKKELGKIIRIEEMLLCSKRYIHFPLYSTPSQLLNMLGLQIPILFLNSIYGTEVVGYYGLANSIVNIPMTLIGKAIGDVFYSEAARNGKKDPEKLLLLSKTLFKKLALIGLLPLILLIIFSPAFFSIVFGSSWIEAGNYARIIAIYIYARFLFMPISGIYPVFEKQKIGLLLDSIRVAMVVIGFVFVILFELNVYWALIIYSIIMIIIYFITYLFGQKIITVEIYNKHVKCKGIK